MVNHQVMISASIMCANWMRLEEDLRALEQAGVRYIHYDVMDGFFVEDYCLGTSIINEIRANTFLAADYHLMVEEPIRILRNFTPDEGAILSIHYEACRNLHRDLIRVKRQGFQAGLVLNPATTLNAIEYVIDEVDTITIMTVNPGFKGQKLVPQMLKKIEALAQLRSRLKLGFKISVDGNVDADNIPAMVAAGADTLVGGSSGLFVAGRPLADSIVAMRRCIEVGLAMR
ncbi:MAG: ribulose-phosphate 3-epimerase [Chloroflexi bacterium]|nr:ribulose-phosphate 3-epimerase [Chloroflexota bacterium]MCI0576898.1 ribulose-phosphate 3-epimerase [Chloroflexota bacterium]MCI0646448.1 ribulose-phosphate 3-epimerase [Chloroflexota bacterium]MCI0729931.1 ribulose-phosphate 3-epimerase [Chloroflexota bacterium]